MDLASSFAVRVEYFNNETVCLIPSANLTGKKFFLDKDKLPEFITEPVAILSMLENYQTVDLLGKKYHGALYYVNVDVDKWTNFFNDEEEK